MDALVRRIAVGDAVALAIFFDDTSVLIRSMALPWLRSREDAEEVALDVLTYVWQHADRYDPTRGTVIAWLSVMTRNKSIDCLRRRKTTTYLEDVIAPLACECLGPEEQAVRTERARALRTGMASLSPLRSRVLTLAFLDEHTHEEIARVTRLPLGTVKSHARRGLRNLRKQLALKIESSS